MLEIVEDILKRELANDENLLWSSQPKQGIVFRGSDFFMIPFSIMWGGFAIAWETTAIIGGAPFFFWVFGIPFVLLGIYFIFGRFKVDELLRKKTYYGITNKRIIIASGLFSRSIKSLDPKILTDLSLTEKAGGIGTICFGQKNPFFWFDGMPIPGMEQYTVPKFDLIENARDVYGLIQKVKSGSV